MFYLVYAVFVSWIRKIIIISFAILLISSCLISKIMVRIKISSIYIYRIHRVKRKETNLVGQEEATYCIHHVCIVLVYLQLLQWYIHVTMCLLWRHWRGRTRVRRFSWKAIFKRHVVAFWNQCITFILFAKICISRKSRRDSAGIFKKPD